MDRTEQIQKTLSKALELMTDGKLEAARTNILQANAEVMHNRLELDGVARPNCTNVSISTSDGQMPTKFAQ